MKYHLLLITISSLVFSCSKQKTDLPNIPPEPPTPPPTINKTLPTISTVAVTSITETYAISGCNLSSNGKDSIQEMGICYSTGYVTTPTVLNEKIFIKKEVNTFTDTLKKLAPNTTYYVRAYAINSVGTAYGQVISFKTQLVPPPPTTINDYDGNVYNVIKIGDQYWTKENFRCTHYNDGTEIIKDLGGNDWEQKLPRYGWFLHWYTGIELKQLGAFYNWYAVNTGKLAPNGWHVATLNDLNKLKSSLTKDMEGQEMKTNSWGGSIKDTMVYKPNRNKSGFSALPLDSYHGNGYSLYQDMKYLNFALFWLSDEQNSTDAYLLSLFSGSNYIGGGSHNKSDGYNVRLVKD